MHHTIQGSILTLERTLAASRQKVWDAFTKPDIFIQWWGPRGWKTEVKEFTFIEGGVNHYGMKCEDAAQTEWFGKYSWGKMRFTLIHPIEGFSYTDYFCDENGAVTEGMPVSTTRMQFIEEEGRTKIVSTTTFESEDALKAVMDMGMLQGITETWDRLEEVVTQ